MINKLRTKGRSIWNQNEKLNGGELSTCRRPNMKFQREPTEFETCENCGEQLRSSGLRRHWNRCTGNPLPGERIVKEFSRVVEGRLHAEASQDLHKVFSQFHADVEIAVIRYDWIVITYGNDLCINLWRDYQFRVIRGKLRSAGKVLIASRSICPEITDFASLYHVSNCNTLVGAIRTIAGFNFETKMFNSPATASALVTLIIAIGDLLLVEYMKRSDEDKEKVLNKFLTVFRKEAKIKINKAVFVTQMTLRRDKIEIMPSTDDVGKLAEYLDLKRELSFTELTGGYSKDKWLRLTQFTMISVLLFNRRRVGDTQNILVKEFEKRIIVAQHGDLPPDETKEMIKSKIVIRGKLHKNVELFLKHHFDDCLELVCRYREKAGVPEGNPYIFGLPSLSGKVQVIDACELLRMYSKACEAEDPRSLRGTHLRKHFATTCGTLNLTDSDVTNVAKFMGHGNPMHTKVYRHNAPQEEAKIFNLLEIARGKKNINITANDTVGSTKVNGKNRGKQKQEQVVSIKKPQQRKKNEAANDTVGSNNVKGKKGKQKQEQVASIKKPQHEKRNDKYSNNVVEAAIKKPQKRKRIEKCSNDEAKIVKRRLASKPYLRE